MSDKWRGALPEPVAVPVSALEVFVEGSVTRPQLDHPEGLAVVPGDAVYCGGEAGQVYRMALDGSSWEQIASTGGFCLGLAWDGDRRLFICDLAHRAVFALDLATRILHPFSHGMTVPNVPVIDRRRRVLYVSDSLGPDREGPGVWRFDLATGAGGVWCSSPFRFANGMALEPGGGALYVAETFARRIRRIAIGPSGEASDERWVVTDLPALPDGLAFAADGTLVISCYEPSCVLALSPAGKLSTVAYDPEAHALCHPTNCAFLDESLLVANLGRWHLTRIPWGRAGATLPE